MRREYRLKLDKIRSAVRYLERRQGESHPLARRKFKTDGVNLFVEQFGKLLSVSESGQLPIRSALEAQLERVEYRNGMAVRLFPLSRPNAPRLIVIDPERAFGRPILKASGVPIAAIRERFSSGESAAELAHDFGVGVDQIEEALRAA